MYMVRHKIRFGKNLVNGLIAVVISLIVNFSYLVYMILAARSTVRPHGYGMEHYTSSVIVEALFYAVMAGGTPSAFRATPPLRNSTSKLPS